MVSNSIQKQMSYSQQEFFKQFRIFASQLDYLVEDNQIFIQEDNRQVRIDIEQNSIRRLGSLLLPQLTVSISFKDFSSIQQREFIDRFNKSFQKGGG